MLCNYEFTFFAMRYAAKAQSAVKTSVLLAGSILPRHAIHSKKGIKHPAAVKTRQYN
jgi:hypothetical protein